MANYQLLKADIDAKVYENAYREITGENLNSVLNAMVTTLGAEYQFAGVATIDTNPGTPDAKVFYIANGKGTYTNFGGLEVTEGEVVVLYWDTAWHKVATGIASQAKLSELDEQINGDSINIDIDIDSLIDEGIYINSDGTWLINNTNQRGTHIDVIPNATYTIKANAIYQSLIGFIKSIGDNRQPVEFATGESRKSIAANTTMALVAPNDALFLWIGQKSYANVMTPQSINVSKGGRIGIADEVKQIQETLNPTQRDYVLKGVFENGSISDTGEMQMTKREVNFFRTLRTRNYIKTRGFNYNPNGIGILDVFEYDSNFSFLRKKTISANYDTPNDVSYIKLQYFVNDNSNKVNISIEQGGLGNTGLEESASNRVRTSWIDIDNPTFDTMWFKGIAYARFYNADKVILQSGSSYARYNSNKGGLVKLSSLLEFLDGTAFFSQRANAKYIRIAFSNEVATESISPSSFDIRFTAGDGVFIEEPSIYVNDFEEVKNAYADANTMSFAFKVNLVNGHQINETDASLTSSLIDNGQYMSSVNLLLPPNYSAKGKPAKLILWCHGSGDYTYLGQDTMSQYYMEYLGYWQKEGFAVADIFARTSKYGSMGGDVNGMPTNVAAYEQGYKWLMDHYNLDANGCYVSAKSMGGVGALAICYSNIPVKAADLLAPALNPYYQQCGYGIASRRDYIDDLKLENADALISNPSEAAPMDTADFNALMISNRDRLVGYNAYFNNVTNKTFNELVPLKFKNSNTYDDVVKLCRCPFRIHIAIDDTTVAYHQSLNLIKAMKNGGCIAEIRTMPANTGQHHAVDNSPLALKVTSIVTSLGYTCTDVPLAYVEAAQWFKYYE